MDKSGTFSAQISVHFGSPSQNVLISEQKNYYLVSIRPTFESNLILLTSASYGTQLAYYAINMTQLIQNIKHDITYLQ